MLRFSIFISAFALTILSSFSYASEATNLCGDAAKKAERDHKLPDGLLQAIALVESGRPQSGTLKAWPWTVNANGRGYYFKDIEEAKYFVKNKLSSNQDSYDVGCFQINAKWHGDAFTTINDMFNPSNSANYAATFLKKLKLEFGDWDTAVKKYHSRDINKGNQYGAKISAIWNKNDSSLNIISTEDVIAATQVSLLSLSPGAVELNVFFEPAPLIRKNALTPLIPSGQ